MAVVLCNCDKKIGSRLDLKSIKSYLETKGQKVFILNKPCEEGIEEFLKSNDVDSLVIGGCSDKSYITRFRDTIRKKGMDPFALSTVTLIGEGSKERAILLLMAAAERLKLFGGTKEENLKPRFGQLSGNMSRRQLFAIPKIQYDLVPSIDAERCRSMDRYCQLCSKICSSKAIISDREGRVLIEKDKCSACGICIKVCPANAIIYPYFTTAEIVRELEVLLRRSNALNIDRRAILFICEDNSSLLYDFLSSGGLLPEGILPVIVPCIGMLNSFFFMYSFTIGAIGIGLLSCKEGNRRCGSKIEDIEKEINLTEKILKIFDVDGERLTLMDMNSFSGLEEALKLFKGRLNELQPISFQSDMATNLNPDEYSLTDLLVEINKITGRGLLLEGNASIPAGTVWLKNDRLCTFCKVCINHCPTNALTLGGEEGAKELMFEYKECVGCGECVRRCPEKILCMKKIIDTERLKNAEKTSLVRESAILCMECGTPFLNEALLQRIREKSGLHDSAIDDFIKMCPDCRAKAIFKF